MKIEINKTDVEKRLSALSAAAHYYSGPGQASAQDEAQRPPLFTSRRTELIRSWYEDACAELAMHLSAWTQAATMDGDILTLYLADDYERMAAAIGSYCQRFVALEIWRRMNTQWSPMLARQSEEERHQALMELLESMLRPVV